MLYNKSFFLSDLRKNYLGSGRGKLKLLTLCFLIALFSIAANSLFIVLDGTVIGDILPHFTSRSLFALANLYNVLIMVFFVFYFCEGYNTLTFADIDRNRCYMLKKSGISNSKVVLDRQLSTVMTELVIYMLGYIILYLYASLMKYSISTSVILPMVVEGLLQLMFLVSIIMMTSLFLESRSGCFAVCVLTLLVMLIVSAVCGFFDNCVSIVFMRDTANLFRGKPSIYVYSLVAGSLVATVISSVLAYKKSHFFTPSVSLQSDTDIIAVDYRTNEEKKVQKQENRGEMIFKRVTLAILTIILALGILANVAIIFIGSQAAGGSSIGNFTPLFFGSEEMSGDIERYDMAIFRTTDGSFEVGDVVLFYENNDAVVKKITEITGDTLTVDVSKYPQGAEPASEVQTLSAASVKGELWATSRWTGAWILLNQSILGKLFTLVVPLLVLAFYDKLERMLRFVVKNTIEE